MRRDTAVTAGRIVCYVVAPGDHNDSRFNGLRGDTTTVRGDSGYRSPVHGTDRYR